MTAERSAALSLEEYSCWQVGCSRARASEARMGTHNQTELLQLAAQWHTRLAAQDCSARDRANFERWLASDAAHGVAFAAVQATAARVSEAGSTDARLQELADAAFAATASKPALRPAWLSKAPLALAAGVLLLVTALPFIGEIQRVVAPTVAYSTAAGETRSVTLSDGSTVSLDVASTIEVRLSEHERAISLTTGRAYFKVAHDASRPFAVTAQNVRTVALGTQFQVQDSRDQVTVTLLEGSVLVSDVAAAQPQWQQRLTPGQQLRIAAGAAAPERRVVNQAVAASWLRGRHVFEATPLAEAIEEINRYSARKLRLGDPSLAELQIGGNFIAGDSESIAAAISAALPVEVVQGGGEEIILFRRHD